MNEKPICEQCVKEGKKYSVSEPQFGITTSMMPSPAYWDEEGNYHESYNPNTTTYEYQCSNGHRWQKVS